MELRELDDLLHQKHARTHVLFCIPSRPQCQVMSSPNLHGHPCGRHGRGHNFDCRRTVGTSTPTTTPSIILGANRPSVDEDSITVCHGVCALNSCVTTAGSTRRSGR